MKGALRVLILVFVILLVILHAAYKLSFKLKPIKMDLVSPQAVLEQIRDDERALQLQSQLEQEDKIVVIGKLSHEDTSWVSSELPEWQSAIYTVDNTTAPLHTPVNKGRETLPYLTYIVDNYHNLPSVIAFVHPHKQGYPLAWHTDHFEHSNVRALRDLDTEFIQETGYANLRCNPDPGCPKWLEVGRGAPGPIGEKETLDAWPQLFGDDVEIPKVIATPCCAQFAVSREQVLKRPLEDYVKWREWVLNSELDDGIVGRVFEYLWHVVFGQDAVFCPPFKQCQCRLYGRYCI